MHLQTLTQNFSWGGNPQIHGQDCRGSGRLWLEWSSTVLVSRGAILRWPCWPQKSAWGGNSPVLPKYSPGQKNNIQQGRNELINPSNKHLLDIYQRKYAFFKGFIITKGNLHIRHLVPITFIKNLLSILKSYEASTILGTVGTVKKKN